MRHLYNKLHLIILLNMLLTGCSSLPTDPDWRFGKLLTPVASQDRLSVLVFDYASFEEMDSKELEDKFEVVKKAFLNKNRSEDRIKYILLLTLPGEKFYDRNAALNLLKEWPEIEQQKSDIISFRNVLITRLEEEERMSVIADHLSEQLKLEKQRSEVLQRKVEAIKAMERKLIRRNVQ